MFVCICERETHTKTKSREIKNGRKANDVRRVSERIRAVRKTERVSDGEASSGCLVCC